MAETSVTVKLVDGMTFRGEDPRGIAITMDATSDAGGRGLGPTPMDVIAMALGGCSGMDVISILRKMRQDVTGYEIRITGTRSETHPHVYTELELEHVLRGADLDPDHVRRAVELSATRYCSASAMLAKAAAVTHRYRVLTLGGEDTASGRIGDPVPALPAPLA